MNINSNILPRRDKGQLLKSLARFLLGAAIVLLMAREAVSGLIRAYLPQIWYLPDAVAVLAIFFAFFNVRRRALVFALMSLVIFGGIRGLYLAGLMPALIGLRYWVFFLVGISYGMFCTRARIFGSAAVFFLAVSLIGVLIDYLGISPWREQADFQGILFSGVSKEWWTDVGVRRLAGFGLSSTDTGAFVAACGVYVLSQGRFHYLIRIAIVASCIAGLFATQQRATALAFLMLVIFLSVFSFGKGKANILGGALIKSLAISAAILTISVPLLFWKVSMSLLTGMNLSSLDERTMSVWPSSLDLLTRDFGFIFGLGVGTFGEPSHLSSMGYIPVPDNIALYLAMSYGVPMALILIGGLIVKIARVRLEGHIVPAVATLGLLLINGLTANLISNSAAMIFAGVSVAFLYSGRSKSFTGTWNN